ncbi:MAG TPA: hypothetical protein DCZ95_09345 [Verrucomicrobia bacterium]|nr:MAG: hypothetical protein A2X46_06390 [Lentisphaerae bacterium GWF2_57_35]HBA84283.1 hypothetical protein [Verrucomicrobiota bacterium]
MLLAGLFVRIFFFVHGLAKLPVSTDESITVLQAREILRGQFPLLFMGQPYLFPLESYLHAPLAAWAPANTFGARYVAFLLGLMSTGLGVLILRRLGGLAVTWPGLLLLMFPSSYVLMLTSAYALPGYSASIFLSTLAIFSVLQYRFGNPPRFFWLAIAGFSAGLAFSGHMLTLPALLAVTAASVFAIRRPRQLAGGGVLLFSALAVGLIPYFLAKLIIHNAHRNVSGLFSAHDAFARFWPVFMKKTLPSAMGLTPTLAPDSGTLPIFAWLIVPFALVWLSVLAATTWVALRGLIAWLRRREDSAFVPALIFSGLLWASMVLFLFTRRAGPGDYRYLILTAWSFPFALGVLGMHFHSTAWRMAVGGLALVLVGINAVAGVSVATHWGDEKTMNAATLRPSLQPVIEYLKAQGIRHAVSSYGTSYRLTFLSDEEIVCSQPINERFPGWPMPYRDAVHGATNVAYVLGRHHRFMTPDDFEEDLSAMNVEATVATCGVYKVYHAFRSSRPMDTASRSALGDFFKATVSHNPATAGRLVDETPEYWRCDGYLQTTGMWVQLEWEKPHSVGAISLDHGESKLDFADRIHVDVLAGGTWKRALENISGRPAPFKFQNMHPVYGHYISRIELPSHEAIQGVRIEVAKPRKNNAWTLAEVQVVEGEPHSP